MLPIVPEHSQTQVQELCSTQPAGRAAEANAAGLYVERPTGIVNTGDNAIPRSVPELCAWSDVRNAEQ